MNLDLQFIGRVLAEAESPAAVAEQFRSFTTDEQNMFIDFMSKVMSTAVEMIKEMPEDIKVEAFAQIFAAQQPEMLTTVLDAMMPIDREGFLEANNS